MSSENDWEWNPPADSDAEPSKTAGDSPYAPPEAAVTEDGRDLDRGEEAPSIYSPSGVGIGTFLGGPVAATVLLYLNFSKLGWDDHARNTVLLGVTATLLAFALAAVIPTGGGTGLTVVWVVAAIWIARHYQNRVESEYVRVPHLSNWNAAGIGCVSMIAMVAFIFVVLFLFGASSV